MTSRVEYGTFANYSPGGKSARSVRSRKLCGTLKRGRRQTAVGGVRRLRNDNAKVLSSFLNPDVTLVPVPRSAPLVEGAVWPPRIVADVLVEEGFGREVLPALIRHSAVRKSSTATASNRPLVHEHVESMHVDVDLIAPDQITIVDDVLTQGRTMAACAILLREAFPDAEIRAFAMFRTQGFVDEIDKVVDPSVGTIKWYDSGKSWREP